MYLRFTTESQNRSSRAFEGIFGPAYHARSDPSVQYALRREIAERIDWFERNLRVPPVVKTERFRTGICWFSSGASEHVGMARELSNLLETAGVLMQCHRTVSPGDILYRDEIQVVARPWRGDIRWARLTGKGVERRFAH
ncbi:MAG: hypothetical protein AAF658_07690 [Myxococcota bacterium]